jgi:hypothetical protein
MKEVLIVATFGTHAEMRNAHTLIVGTLEGKRLLGRPECGGRIILKFISKTYAVECIHLAQDRELSLGSVTDGEFVD